MAEWGRKEYTRWPIRGPVWSIGAFFLAALVFVGVLAGSTSTSGRFCSGTTCRCMRRRGRAAASSVQRLAEARGIKLTRHGADLLGKCPFHNDRTPSLVITPAKKSLALPWSLQHGRDGHRLGDAGQRHQLPPCCRNAPAGLSSLSRRSNPAR